MGLYSFKPQFTPHILSGRKKHTIRDKRKDGWVERPGNTMYLYENVRTKEGKHIADRECVKIEEISIDQKFRGAYPHIEVKIEGVKLTPDEKQTLAYHDGFESFAEMAVFWNGRLPFEGYIIHWR